MAAVQEPLELPGGTAKGAAMAKVGINGQARHLLERIHSDGDSSPIVNGERKRGADTLEEKNPAKMARLQIEALERHQEVMNQTLDACTDPRKAQALPITAKVSRRTSSEDRSSETTRKEEDRSSETVRKEEEDSSTKTAANNGTSPDCDMVDSSIEPTSIKDAVSASSPAHNGVEDTALSAALDTQPPNKTHFHSISPPPSTALTAANSDSDASAMEHSPTADAVKVHNGKKTSSSPSSTPAVGESSSADIADQTSGQASNSSAADISAVGKEKSPVKSKEDDLLNSTTERSQDNEEVESLDSEEERDLLDDKPEIDVPTKVSGCKAKLELDVPAKASGCKATEGQVKDKPDEESSPEVIELMADDPEVTPSLEESKSSGACTSDNKTESKETSTRKPGSVSPTTTVASAVEVHEPLRTVDVEPDVIELDDSLDDLETDLPDSQSQDSQKVVENLPALLLVKASSTAAGAASVAVGISASSQESLSLPTAKQADAAPLTPVDETSIPASSPISEDTVPESRPSIGAETCQSSTGVDMKGSSEKDDSAKTPDDSTESAGATVQKDPSTASTSGVSDKPSEIVSHSSDSSLKTSRSSPLPSDSPKPVPGDSLEAKQCDKSVISSTDSSKPSEPSLEPDTAKVSDSASKQELPKSTPDSKDSNPDADDSAVMIIDDDDDDDVQISKVEEKSEGSVTPRPSSAPGSCSSPRSPRSSAVSPAKAVSPTAEVLMETDDDVQMVTEEEFKPGESKVTLTKKSLELLVKKRMIAMFRSSQNSVVSRLHARIQDLQQEAEKWRTTARDLEKQMQDVSARQHAARTQRRQAKIEAVAQQQQAQEAQVAAGKASRASPGTAAPTSPGRSMPPGGVSLMSPAGPLRGQAPPGPRAPTVRTMIDQNRAAASAASTGRGAPRAPARPVGTAQPGAAPRPGGAGVIDLTDDDDAARATAPGAVGMLRGMVPNMVGQQLVRAADTSLTSIRPGTLLIQPTTSGAPVLVQPVRSQGPGTFVLTRPSVSQVMASTGPMQPLEPSGVRCPTSHMVTLGRPGAMAAMRLNAPITVTTTANALRHPAPLPPPPMQTSPMGLPKQPPLKPGLKISRVQQGIVLSWNMTVTEALATIANYQLFAYQEGSAPPNTNLWKKVGDVKALPLPMACTLTQFQEGNKYHFAVRAVDVHGRIGPFSDPSSIHLVPQSS